MRKDQLRTYISKRDANIRLVSDRQQRAIKNKRAKFRAKQEKQIEKRLRAREGQRNLNVLSDRQAKKKEKQILKAQRIAKKLKYKKASGDIAFKDVMDYGAWKNNFVSSNVWKFKKYKNHLIIAFLDGSVYIYYNLGDKFLGILNAGSKGKWVWNNLIRKGASYSKIR